MNKNLIIFAVPRTGSTFVSNLLGSLNEFDFMGEIYSPQKVHALNQRKLDVVEYVSQAKADQNIKINAQNLEQDLVKFAHNFPSLFLESLRNTSKSKYFGFKMFQYHLDLSTITNLLLNDSKVTKLVLKRNPLDIYASLSVQEEIVKQKTSNQNQAKAFKKTYHNFDTTNIKGYFDQDKFTKLVQKIKKYYSFLDQAAKKSPEEYIYLDYEDIHQHQSNSDKSSFIFDLLEKKGFEIDRNQDFKQHAFLQKQDSRGSIFEKFQNPLDLERFLEKNNLEIKL